MGEVAVKEEGVVVYRQQDARALYERMKALKEARARLEEEETAVKAECERVTLRILAGTYTVQSGSLIVRVERQEGARRPAWKDEATKLAVEYLLVDGKKYQESVVARTPAPVKDALIIEPNDARRK